MKVVDAPSSTAADNKEENLDFRRPTIGSKTLSTSQSLFKKHFSFMFLFSCIVTVSEGNLYSELCCNFAYNVYNGQIIF